MKKNKLLALMPDVHAVVETDLAYWLRNELKAPGLFTYWHLKNHTWVVAEWVDEGLGICQEYAVLGPDLQGYDPWWLTVIRWMKSDDRLIDMQRLRDDIAGEASDAIRRDQDDLDEHINMVEFLRKRGSDHWDDHPAWKVF